MKDMLVDMHSPAYHHLMARANYNIDAHSYLELTQYLQNLGLIEESFNNGNAQNKSSMVATASPRLIRPIRTTRSMARTTAGSIRMVNIPGLTVLITRRVRIIGATRMPPITTTTATIRTTS
jgi:hypothetical protein